MKSCRNCCKLEFPKEIGSTVVMRCGLGRWEWDQLEYNTPMSYYNAWRDCTDWCIILKRSR